MARYTITVESKNDDPQRDLRGIRSLLKRLGRNYRLRCVSAQQVDDREPAPPADDNQLMSTDDGMAAKVRGGL